MRSELPAAHARGTTSGASNEAEVLDGGKRVVEVMQEPPPLLVLRRRPETLGVVFDGRPLHEQQVAVRPLRAPVKLQRLKPWHRSDDRLRLGEGGFEVRFPARLHFEESMLCDHASIIPDASRRLPDRAGYRQSDGKRCGEKGVER